MEQSNIQWIRENVDWLNNEMNEFISWDAQLTERIGNLRDLEDSIEWAEEDMDIAIDDANRVLTAAEEMKLMAGRIIGDIIETTAKTTPYEVENGWISWDQKGLDYWEKALCNTISWVRDSLCIAEEAKSLITSLEQGPGSTEQMTEWLNKNMEQLRKVELSMRWILDELRMDRIDMILKKCPQEVAKIAEGGAYDDWNYEPDITGLQAILDDLDSGRITPEEI